jgi:hypothetical protein
MLLDYGGFSHFFEFSAGPLRAKRGTHLGPDAGCLRAVCGSAATESKKNGGQKKQPIQVKK